VKEGELGKEGDKEPEKEGEWTRPRRTHTHASNAMQNTMLWTRDKRP
jgi:hypothetical protein